jgi:hypothetical protein
VDVCMYVYRKDKSKYTRHAETRLEDKACDDIDLLLVGNAKGLSSESMKWQPLFSTPIGKSYSNPNHTSTRYVYNVDGKCTGNLK